ncbi:hypothetical protein Tamer19_42550 [Cupriavidus sp. TA19]|uniref:bactofilin family protein n=1 Tax=unclassified Cupriavidus TaxID=2640874 RepID=UPI000E2FC646|nr:MULTISPECIES: polymer-forming cytoskeletal protein [unclassified Cupriavidus]BDB30485.1 polymer-forming cytoskeletal protein [Cupriavidus sp. P-10]GLC94847.1 hypothetical protein Tamer19_42550 [Cupriavidus sp. TA19]
MQSNPPILTRFLLSTGLVRKKQIELPIKSLQDEERQQPRTTQGRPAPGGLSEAGMALTVPAIPTKVKIPRVDGTEVVHTLIPASMTVVGEIEIGENVVFQGPVRGNITVTGDHQVILTKTSSVHGSIRGKAVIVSCHVEGDIEAERVILTEGAAVRGDIRYSTLAMAEGARLDGRLTMVIPNVITEQPADPDPVKELGIDLGANARVELNREDSATGGESTSVSELRPAAARLA